MKVYSMAPCLLVSHLPYIMTMCSSLHALMTDQVELVARLAHTPLFGIVYCDYSDCTVNYQCDLQSCSCAHLSTAWRYVPNPAKRCHQPWNWVKTPSGEGTLFLNSLQSRQHQQITTQIGSHKFPVSPNWYERCLISRLIQYEIYPI